MGRLVHSDGGPLLIQFVSDACVSSRKNEKRFFLLLTCHNQSTLLAQYNLQLEVLEVELSEEVKKKERKVPTAALLRTVRSLRTPPFAL